MNKVSVISLVVLSLAMEAAADFKFPKNVYAMDKLDDAKAEAVAKAQAITFIYTRERASGRLCASASLYAAERLGKVTVVVYADSESDWKRLPHVVQAALDSPEAGHFIPKTVVVDAAMANVLAVIPYAIGDELDRLLKAAKKKLPDVRPKPARGGMLTPPPDLSAYTIAPDETREMRTWLSRTGVATHASLVSVRGGTVVLKRDDGSQVEMFERNLSAGDQRYLQGIKNGASAKPPGG